MKNKRGLHLTAIVLIMLLLTAAAHAKYSGGTGDPCTPYKISDFNDLMALRADSNDWDKCFILTADIDLDPNLPGRMVFTTAFIAPYRGGGLYLYPKSNMFSGIFDGNEHRIENLNIDTLADTNTANDNNSVLSLFGFLDPNCEVRHLVLERASVRGGTESIYIGGLAGWSLGKISDCVVSGNVAGDDYTGGAYRQE
jgi:hypothetical protein